MPYRRWSLPLTVALAAACTPVGAQSLSNISYVNGIAIPGATQDLAGASSDFNRALQQWPQQGVPATPDAWLMTVARRRLLDGQRHSVVAARAEPALTHAQSVLLSLSAETPNAAGDRVIPDRRLELMFACAHPSIDEAIRTPLMLQTILGLEATDIASVFLTAPAAMAQRLVRAKRKIRDAGVPFEIPAQEELPGRLVAVLEAIYAAFATGWEAADGSDLVRADLANEAIFLARVVVNALPQEPEASGLFALLLYCDSRREARRTPEGAYVPLSAQRVDDWDGEMIAEAERLLQVAARCGRAGRFQLEAAIQSAHVAQAHGDRHSAVAIVALYDGLLHYAPTVGALVGRAAAVGEAYGPAAGLEAADALCPTHVDASVLHAYQPWWALRAHLLQRVALTDPSRVAEAQAARRRAAGLTQDAAVRAFLLRTDSFGGHVDWRSGGAT